MPLPLNKNQDALSDFQRRMLKLMADPALQVGTASAQIKTIALERRKRQLVTIDITGILDGFVKQLQEDDAVAQKFPRARLQLSDFDNTTFATRTIQQWLGLSRDVTDEYYTGKGVYCTCFDGNHWDEGVATDVNSERGDKVVVVTATGKRLYPQLFVYIWGEDILLYNQRLQNALIQRNLCESNMRMERYISHMPTESNAKYPQALRDEVKLQAPPFFCKHYVLGIPTDIQ